MERHFENPDTYVEREPCKTQCSFCTGEYKGFTGQVSKTHLIAALRANIFDRGSVQADKLVTFLTDKKNKNKLRTAIWGVDVDVSSGHIHGLVLQLIVSGLLDLRLESPNMIRRSDIKMKDVRVSLAKATLGTNENSYTGLAIDVESNWIGFNLKSN